MDIFSPRICGSVQPPPGAGLKPDWAFVATDNRYLDTLGLSLVAGRNFPNNRSVDEVPYFIVNQKAVEEMKLKDPVGARFSLWGWNGTVLVVAAWRPMSPSGKEIGIRKVLGASLPDILRQINKEFLWPILLSNLVAWPAAYWAMKTWLQGFAFRTNISPWIFFVSAASVLAIGLLTVSFQSFKAAREDPANSLKCE